MDLTNPPWPVPGDVIFTYSGGKEALGSCLLQRLVFDRTVGPWFSHVAVALSQRIVLEASTEPEADETTWSGATLGGGVRLQLIPDLFAGSSAQVVLRHPSATVPMTFGTSTPYIALMYGCAYSTKSLVAAGREASSILAALIPQDSFEWRAPADSTWKTLTDNPELRAAIEQHFQPGELLEPQRSYFCSQLVSVVLWRLGLLEENSGNITPCGLFDRLEASQWKDVTLHAYGERTREGWRRQTPSDWRVFHDADVGQARFFRDAQLTNAMVQHLADKLGDFGAHLDATAKRLDEMRGQ